MQIDPTLTHATPAAKRVMAEGQGNAVDLDLEKRTLRCNCSLCSKSRAWFAFAPAHSFQLKRGGDDQIHYRWTPPGRPRPNLTYHICATCGVRTYAEGMGPQGHVVHYTVRRGELINIVAHFDSDSWTEESWTRECDLSELTTTYAGWHPDLLRLYTYSARWYKWALYDRDPAERWSKGRVTLLGDSAHAMLPYLGQGAAMAIEDACVLSAAIARHANDLDRALLAYERVRVPRARAAVLGSRERARENHLASPWARLKRDVKFALRERFGRDKTVFQTAWLYGYDVGRELG